MADDERAQRYRDEAERCRRLASAVRDAPVQRQLLEIAVTYERLALQIEALGHWGKALP